MLSFLGHCFGTKHEIISDVLLWCPADPKGSRKCTFLDVLKREAGLEIEELGTAMTDHEQWREGYCLFPDRRMMMMMIMMTYYFAYVHNCKCSIYLAVIISR